MSKAMLVLKEMPEKCDDCILLNYMNNNWYCSCLNQKVVRTTKPDLCPLQEMPETKSEFTTKYHVKKKGWIPCKI